MAYYINKEDCFRRGMNCYQKKEYEKALPLFLQAAKVQHKQAMYNCALMYELGLGTEEDPVQALYWYEYAAKFGDCDARYECGEAYRTGKGTAVDAKKALYYYKKASREIGAACFYCGVFYEYGRGTSVNPKKAFKYYEMGAKKEHVESMTNLAICYNRGFGAREDQALAFYWYEKAAEQGFMKAQLLCAQRCETGKGTEKDLEKAIWWYEQAARQGSEKAIQRLQEIMAQRNEAFERGTALEASGNPEAALEAFLLAADWGHPEAQNICARLFAQAGNVQKEKYWRERMAENSPDACYEKAREYATWSTKKEESRFWMEKAAEQGHLEAQLNCYDYYIDQEHCDFTRALYWVEKAAIQGHAEAQYTCAEFYMIGRGTKEDKQRALYWVEKAAEQGHIKSQCWYANLYDKGIVVEQDCKKAFSWYEKAARQGDAMAQFKCGEKYRIGEGVEMDHEKAIYWLEKSAAQDYKYAKEKLLLEAKVLLKGRGKLISEGKILEALQALAKAAEWGEVSAQIEMAEYYDEKPDPKKALMWYERAADNGDRKSQYLCALRYFFGNGCEINYVQAESWASEAMSLGHPRAALLCAACVAEQEHDTYNIKDDVDNYVDYLRIAMDSSDEETRTTAKRWMDNYVERKRILMNEFHWDGTWGED